MGEETHNYHSEDLSQAKEQKPERLAPSGETVTVQAGEKQKEKRLPLMPVEVYTKLLEQRVSKLPVRPSPLLKAFGDLLIAKELLLTKIEELQVENQEFREQEEQRKKQNREAYERYVQKDPDAYRAKKREEMRQRRAAQK